MNRRIKMFKRMFVYTSYIALIVGLIISSRKVENFKVYNANGSKYLNSYQFTNGEKKTKNLLATNQTTKAVSTNAKEASKEIDEGLSSYAGTMTAYGPDCVGCSGIVACSPRRDVRNGNIYYNHDTYGKMRVVAADRTIPCGTVVKVSGVKGQGDFYAIVLDRGGAIKGTLFDLLFNSSAEAKSFGRQSVNYTTIRWGW